MSSTTQFILLFVENYGNRTSLMGFHYIKNNPQQESYFGGKGVAPSIFDYIKLSFQASYLGRKIKKLGISIFEGRRKLFLRMSVLHLQIN
ncbi:hypothetical protein ACJX0J_038166, partial [Zea mays]